MTASVWLVAEAGTAGFGHVSRVVALAQALGDLGADAVVHCPRGTDFLGLCAVPVDIDGALLDGADWVVADMKAPVSDTEASRLAEGRLLCLIDDAGPGRRRASLALDPPTVSALSTNACPVLGGPEHVLLRREFRDASPAPQRIMSALVTLGGSDPAGVSGSVAEALVAAGFDVDLVAVGGGGPVPRGPAEMATRFHGKGVVVCGFGHTIFECARMGVPAIALGWSDAADVDAATVERLGFMKYGGSAWAAGMPADVAAAAGELVGDAERWSAMSRAGTDTVDGCGAERVAQYMLARLEPLAAPEATAQAR